MSAEVCRHCGQPPHEFVDVGVGRQKPEIVCCQAAQREAIEDKRHACEVRFLAGLRAEGRGSKFLADVEKHRGKEAADKLKADALALWAERQKGK